mgnify:CR=1 FL=1
MVTSCQANFLLEPGCPRHRPDRSWPHGLPLVTLTKALVAAAMVLAGAGCLLSAGGAQAANAYSCVPRTSGGTGGFVNLAFSAIGVGDTVSCADKQYTVNGFDFGGNRGDVTFEWTPVDPNPGYLDDLFSTDLRFSSPSVGPQTGFFDYSVKITDPSYYFNTVQLDSSVALSAKPNSDQTVVTKAITGPTGSPVLKSMDGSRVGPIYLLPDNTLKAIQVRDSWTVAPGDGLTSVKDTFTQDSPAPLPLLGAGAALAWSRKLRSRVKWAGR